MTDKKQPGDHPSEAINSEKEADDEEAEFVEMDPTGRYGRYNEILGKGAFKTVYRAFDEVDGIEVAWNQVKVEDVLQSPEDLERLYSEVHLLKSLKHKNIIKLYNSWVDTKTKNVNFITEIFTSGTLRQYRKKHKHVDIRAVKNWAKQILRGLLYLHSHNPPIIHRDLKCDNIFVNGNQGEVKIGDLGLAAILRQANAAHSVIGTPEFMAPELYEEEYNELVDIYSFGMCLLEMVTFEYPYSECNNAAQIYKKVTSGKKPAALEKVKDLEVRAFIEKCLATASRRLPARELLMDPFLQSEQTDMDLLPPLSRSTSRADDMEGLSTIKEEPSSMCRPPSVESNSRRTEASPTREREMKDEARCNEERLHSNDQSRTSSPEESQSDSDQGIIGNFQKGSSFREEGRGRSRDFRVKGKKKDDDTVFLRVRIADLEGHIRNIHFPFSIEGDTAMSVASEMVGELDLSDQDVTTIAEMIDAAIVALVPDWRPGAAFDDNGADEQAREESPMVLPQSPEEETHAAVEVISRDEMDTENNIMPIDILPVSTIKTRSPRTGPLSYSPRVEGSYMHGRFEEVTYHPEGSEFAYKFDTPHIFSSDSSEVREDGDDWDLSGEVISPVGTSQGTFCLDVKTEQTPTNLLKIVEHQNMDSDAPGCNEVLVTIKSSGCAIGEQAKEEDSILEETSGTVAAVVLEGPSGAVTTVQSNSVHVDTSNSAEQDESIARELKLLAMRQEQELRELQRKHESALLEIRNRCRCKRSSSLNSPQILSPHDQNVDTLSHLLDSELGRAVDESGKTLVAISDRNNLLQCKPDQGFCFFDQNNPNTSNTPQVGSPSSASASCSNECFTDLLEFQAAKSSETTVLRTAGIWPVSSMEESLSKENGGCSSSASYETLFDGSERFVDASCSERPDVTSEFSGRETALSGNMKQQNEASTSGLFLSGEEKHNVLRTPPSPGNQSGQRIEAENTEQGEPGISDVAGKTFLSGDVASRTFLSGPARSLSGDVAGSTRRAADETRTVLLGQGSQEELLVRSLSADVGRGLSGKREESMGILRYNQQQEEQQRKEQLQKSIAELEAKTLEGLHYSKNGYLVSSKKMSGINQQQQQQQQP